MPHWRIVALCLPLALLLPAFARSVRAAEEATPSFYRGININGSSVVIDGRGWDGADAQGYVNKDRPFENQRVELSPATDADRARMIRSSTYTPNGQNKVLLNGIPAGTYSVWLYVWEDNDSQSYDLFLNGQRVESGHKSGSAGTWQRLGPWVANIDNGKIELTSRGGHANFSGIEIWTGAVKQQIDPVADTGPPVDALPAEHLRFFESKIRPVLVERCYKCHSSGAKSIEGGLLLDSRLGVLKGGDRGRAIEPGDADASLLVQAIRYEDDDLQMPPDEKLSAAVIADFEQWIGLGAPDPRTAASVITKVEVDLEKARGHWSFQPVREPAVPQVADKRWPLTPVDHFILAKLEANGLRPVEIADRRALVRRATIDLIGLPPTPEEVDEFVNDPASLDEAFRHVVERLLASRHYGERWGRHWMDLVRYADTAGDNSDYPVPQLYLYRNYVIQSFNADKPYDQFLREQIAGDLLSAESPEQQNEQTIATGYIALSRRFGSIIDGYPQHLTIEDTIENLGRTVLGLAISCARCHDHKFDPISQADYYGLYGIFNSTRYPFPGIELDKKPRDFVSLEKTASSPGGLAYAVAEGKTGDARLHRRGDPKNPGDVVPRKFLDVLGGQRLSEDVAKTSGRLQLAHWLTDPANPLTARVMVNRIWQYHFGRGLVETPSDLGTRGLPPTHPELLDYLAARFVEDGWSIKNMHRLIMQSQAYQLSSVESWPPDA